MIASKGQLATGAMGGMRLLKQALLSDAFASFTEAIRLCPSSAAYHANRASLALRLGRFTIALEDARCADSKQALAVESSEAL